jgi:hypothetical protein
MVCPGLLLFLNVLEGPGLFFPKQICSQNISSPDISNPNNSTRSEEPSHFLMAGRVSLPASAGFSAGDFSDDFSDDFSAAAMIFFMMSMASGGIALAAS